MPSKYKRKSRLREPYRKIVIAMEGNITEPSYFNAVKKKFNAASLRIVPLTRAKTDTKSAPVHVVKQLSDFKKENHIAKFDELWLVIDKDRWGDRQLCEIARECENSNYRLALSNPCFEIWLILHFKKLSDLRCKVCSTKKIKKLWNSVNYNHNNPSITTIIENINTAVVNAERLDIDKKARWPNKAGTHVYKLVESIENNR